MGANIVGNRTVDCPTVVDKKRFAGYDCRERVNAHPIVRLDGFATNGAGMVQKAGVVVGRDTVDHTAIRQALHEWVAKLGALSLGSAASWLLPPCTHDQLAREDRLQCEQSHAMDR